MGKYFSIGAFCLLFIVATLSCVRKEESVSIRAKEFLDAYFKTDYLTASTCCTKELGEKLLVSLRQVDSIEASVKEILMRQVKNIKTEILSVDLKSEKNKAKVLYKVILPNFPNGIEKTLSLVRVGDEWKVGELGQ